jgi:hypothetical protein
VAVLLIIFGVLAVAGGIFGRDFRAADVIALREFRQKSSKWSARLVFFVVGLALIGVGIKMLVGTD